MFIFIFCKVARQIILSVCVSVRAGVHAFFQDDCDKDITYLLGMIEGPFQF